MRLSLLVLLVALGSLSYGQIVPSAQENVAFIITFGKQAEKAWGDDDFVQTYFVAIPPTQKKAFYIRVFDPEVGGVNDQKNSGYNTKTTYSIYGGKGAYSNKAARKVDPVPGYKSGVLLDKETFGVNPKYDGKWYNFGPYNPKEGEFDQELNGYIFKIICEGGAGDDGNAYRYAISNNANRNEDVEGAKAFTYEVAFRLKEEDRQIAHFYPFIDKKVVSMRQSNFDFDSDGALRVTSVVKNKHALKASGNGRWATSEHKIVEAEHETSLDIQLIKTSSSSNDMVLYLKNQYGEAIPFFSIPLGGVPKYRYNVDVKYQFR